MRLHLQEIHGEHLRHLEKPDSLIVVGPYLRRVVARDFGIPAQIVTVIPNAVTSSDLPVEEAPERRFRVGLVGLVPARKRLDLALDIVAQLRAHDPRFRLVLRGRAPHDHAWVRERGEQAEYFAVQDERMSTEPLLRGGVEHSPFGPDMSEFYSGMGYVLSTSDFESFHFTLPDGAAHGSVPVSLPWRGVDELYPRDWIATDPENVAARILHLSQDDDMRRAVAAQARTYVRERFDPRVIENHMLAEILGS